MNAVQTEAELAALRRSGRCGWPFREALSSDQLVRCLGLEMTLRPQGRPKKPRNGFPTPFQPLAVTASFDAHLTPRSAHKVGRVSLRPRHILGS